MPKSTMAQVVAVSRQVNALDARGKLVILRDLQAQGLEQKAMDRVFNAGVGAKALKGPFVEVAVEPDETFGEHLVV